jgi:HEAT repeat protein
VGALIEALEDPVPDVVEEAARALGNVGDPCAVPQVVSVLRDPRSASSRRVVLAAARALGSLGGEEATRALLDLLAPQVDEELQEAAVRSLGEIGDDRVIPALLSRLEDDRSPRNVRLALVRAVGELGDLHAAPVLRKLIGASDSDPSLLPALAHAMARIQDTDAVLPLVDKLATLDSAIARKQVAYAVGILLDAGRETYSLLSHEDFARDAAVSKTLAELQKAHRPAAGEEPPLRAALEAYTSGRYGDFVRALCRADWNSPTQAPGSAIAACRALLDHLRSAPQNGVPAEVALIGLCALCRLTGVAGRS